MQFLKIDFRGRTGKAKPLSVYEFTGKCEKNYYSL